MSFSIKSSSIIYYLAFAILLISCELSKEIDYNTTFDDPKLIMHGFVNIEDGAQVMVKKTVDPDNINDDDRVEDVKVFLVRNNTDSIILNKETDYFYSANTPGFINNENSYHIRAKANGFQDISSKTQMILETPVIDSVNLLIDKTYYSNLVLHFNNTYSEKESFYINVIYYLDGETEETMTSYEKFNPFSIIKDAKPQSNSVEYHSGHASYFDSLKVELYVLSDDLSQFLISQQNYDYSKEDPFYPQTYPVYTNISGGYGIFASYSYSSTIIQKPLENENN